MRPIIIPLFAGKPSHPFVPLGRRPAGARSEGQGRPKAGALRAPLTAASTPAGWRRSGVGSAVVLAVVLLSGGVAPALAMAQEMPVARSAPVHPYAAHVASAARRFGIPEAWIWAVMRVESGGNARAVSRAGAMGLMQIMPATWAGLRTRYGLGPDPFDVRDNIMAGAAYLREMHDRYGNASAMLAAYNAGPGRYDDFVSRGRPLPPETVGYLDQLAPITGVSGAVEVAANATPDPFAWRRAALFVRTASAASETVAGESGGEVAASEPPTDRPTSGDVRAAEPSANEPRDTLFVPRVRAGRPR
ncbi:lytic transglycosylase domain-containing protein [Sphingomonas koreensis]|uniref:Lytic transglycosylase n=2 Tax=Sphingomonas koreensis TaxID=93064 RepID=A0A1L6J5Y9_9SPHN|nr:lytic transglycosylase [Sphingomonas koreensis]RSU21616.1 lytic transglycosylase domain-containing protein [Sphingomonas koreensis]RSU27769.1 lytic transglycosylase domain-containing protein [Sphingomonas koreensis]RSU29041.1 lytic transglycosylase domain-containing protein [Sphingomonas koreensis]RSU29341.1 lytic transglycosylase domain-containing protein [Sphingomonas koreensis]